MVNKIFVSYKYKDSDVLSLKNGLEEILDQTTVRSYVDLLENYFDATEFAIYKGESDDEDLSDLSDDAIWEKLKDRIYDSTVTIVMISQNMKEPNRRDRSQWIPWEISYSLKETTRNDRTSHSNALLAVVLPDRKGSYEYFIEEINCPFNCRCQIFKTDTLFTILEKNMFNQNNKTRIDCEQGRNVYQGECSYIKLIKWCDFVEKPQEYIKTTIEIKKNIDEYEIVKELN
jgi:hypothetical protein